MDVNLFGQSEDFIELCYFIVADMHSDLRQISVAKATLATYENQQAMYLFDSESDGDLVKGPALFSARTKPKQNSMRSAPTVYETTNTATTVQTPVNIVAIDRSTRAELDAILRRQAINSEEKYVPRLHLISISTMKLFMTCIF